MGLLFLILMLILFAIWGIGLGQARNGEPKLSFVFSGLAFLLSVATVLAVMLLPRSAFGELGHGDGMGLIGLTIVGMIGAVVGAITLAITNVVFLAGQKRRAKPGKE